MPEFAHILLEDLRHVDQQIRVGWPDSCGVVDRQQPRQHRPAARRAAPIRQALDGVAPAIGRRSGIQRAGHRSMATGRARQWL